MTTTLLAVSLGLGICSATFLLWRILEHFKEESIRHQVLTTEVAKTMERLTVRVFIMKGLMPHHADSEQFLPGGMSYQAYEKAKEDAVPNESRDMEADEERSELERQLAEARAIWAQQPQPEKVESGLRQYEEIARQAVELERSKPGRAMTLNGIREV